MYSSDLIDRYLETQNSKKVTLGKLEEINSNLSNQKNQLEIINNNILKSKSTYNNLLEEKINNFIKEKEQEIKYTYSHYFDLCDDYKNDILENYNSLVKKVYSMDYIDNSQFEERNKEIEERIDKFNQIINYEQDSDLISSVLSSDVESLTEDKWLSKVSKWLNYFKDYDSYDTIFGKILAGESFVLKKTDTATTFMILFILLSLVAYFRIYVMIPYFVFLCCTLYIRLRTFYYFTTLINNIAIYNDKLKEMKLENEQLINNEIKKIIDNADIESLQEQNEVKHIKKLIETKQDESLKSLKESLDMNELREKAKAEIDYSGKDLENKSKELEALILETKETKDDIEVELEERENELRELRKQIKESYEELKPNFSRHNMLNKFFLGFNQNNEDVNVFKYSQEPILFCYDGKNSDKNSIISTIKMICSQVMSNMNPLSYKINLIDTVTGGNDFIAFTNSVNDTSTDEIFQLHTTKDEVSELNKHLEEEVKKRRQEILISSDNINEYNDRNVERGARPYPVEMYIYYQYNIIDIVKQEQLDNLFNSSKNLGIYLIYMVDYTQFSPTKDTSKELNTDYKYSIDEFIQTIKKFKPECMFNFKPEDSSVTIQQTTPENLVDICKKQIKPIREV